MWSENTGINALGKQKDHYNKRNRQVGNVVAMTVVEWFMNVFKWWIDESTLKKTRINNTTTKSWFDYRTLCKNTKIHDRIVSQTFFF